MSLCVIPHGYFVRPHVSVHFLRMLLSLSLRRVPKMMRPPENRIARNDTATAARKWCGRPKTDLPTWSGCPKTDMPGNEAPGFSVTEHSGGRIIFGRGRLYPFGQIGFWQTHQFRAQTAVSFWAQKAVMSPDFKTKALYQNKVWTGRWSLSLSPHKKLFSTNQRKTKKTLHPPFCSEKKEKRKQKGVTPAFFSVFLVPLSITRRWLNCSLSDYSPPSEPSVLSSDFFGTKTRMQLFFHVCPVFEFRCNSRGFWFLLDFSIMKAAYQVL